MKDFANGIVFSINVIFFLLTWLGSVKVWPINYNSSSVLVALKIILTVVWLFGMYQAVKGTLR